jgi:hypothetical protein
VNLIDELHVAHATEEKSVVPPRWCRVLLHTLRRLGNRVPPRRGCRKARTTMIPSWWKDL